MSSNPISNCHKPLWEIAKGVPAGILLGLSEKWLPRGSIFWLLITMRILENLGKESDKSSKRQSIEKQRKITTISHQDQVLLFLTGFTFGLALANTAIVAERFGILPLKR